MPLSWISRSLEFKGFAGAEFFEDVVHASEGEVRVKFLLAFALGVEALAKVADALLERGFGAAITWTWQSRSGRQTGPTRHGNYSRNSR